MPRKSPQDDDEYDFKDVIYPPPIPQVEAWRLEARALLDRLRARPVCLILGRAPGHLQDVNLMNWLILARDCDTLVFCESKRNQAEVIAQFAELEQAIANGGFQAVGDVKITSATHEGECVERDMVQEAILFPYVETAWWQGGREIDWLGRKWAHRAELGYQVSEEGQQPENRNISVLHLGLPAAAALVMFFSPHGVRPAVVIGNPVR